MTQNAHSFTFRRIVRQLAVITACFLLLQTQVLHWTDVCFAVDANADGDEKSLSCPHCGADFSIEKVAPNDMETLNREFNEAVDGFYVHALLRQCPNCGPTLPEGDFAVYLRGDAERALPTSVSAYLDTDEFADLAHAAPPCFIFGRILERLAGDAEAGEPAPFFHALTASMYAAGAWEAAGGETRVNKYRPNAVFVQYGLSESKRRLETLLESIGDDTDSFEARDAKIVALYSLVDINRRLGRFAETAVGIEKYRRLSARFDDALVVWPSGTFTLRAVDELIDVQADLMRQWDMRSQVPVAGVYITHGPAEFNKKELERIRGEFEVE